MVRIDVWNFWLMIVLMINSITGFSVHQPKFCAPPVWNPNATTFANSSTIGFNLYGIFIDINNTIYVPETNYSRVEIWLADQPNPSKNISGNLYEPYSVFVTTNGDIYIDNGVSNGAVNKRSVNATQNTIAMYVPSVCYALFLDIKNNLYCSLGNNNQVVKKLFNDSANISTVVAGNGTAGSGLIMLNNPRGIFVDLNFSLYVADYTNNRIQVYQAGSLTGTTIVGQAAAGTTNLNCPIAFVIDAAGYFFILEYYNNRIIGNGPNGYRCIVGCTNTTGSAANQLSFPWSFSFDSYGNIYVIDRGNSRIQKFVLSANYCDPTTTHVIDTTYGQPTTKLVRTTVAQAATSFIDTTVAQTSIRSTNEQTSAITTIMPDLRSSLTSTISSSIITPVSIVNQSCFLPVITLIPSTSSLLYPIQFQRNQDFSISSNIQLNCNKSLSIITQWTINNCTLNNCSSKIQIDPTVSTTFSELYIPARTLPVGIYELKLTVMMVAFSNLISSSSTYVKIAPSGIIINLIQYGTSMITHGYQQNLTIDPGRFSVDLDGDIFNASDWTYNYYCRVYGLYQFPQILGSLLSLGDPRIDPFNPSCLSNQSGNNTILQYGGTTISPNSSVTILSGSLLSNRTYQFMVQMKHAQISSLQATGYLLVRMNDFQSKMIVVACVISTMCVPNLEFQLLNPTTQVALVSACRESCSSLLNITWNIYQGINSSMSIIQWSLFNQINPYQNIWFFGVNTSNFTASNRLFLENPLIMYWKFEVVYTFVSETSSSALNFIINQSPRNGSCSISPFNGTTNTLFTISCQNWFDENGIKDYSLYGYTEDPAKQVLIAFSSMSKLNVRLPCGDDHTSLLNLMIVVRDAVDCVTEFNITSVIVTSDSSSIDDLIKTFENSPNSLTSNSYIQLLSSENQNTVGQILTSLSQQFNKINTEVLENAVSNGIPGSKIFVSQLGSESLPGMSASLNSSALYEYNKQLNTYANIRDYLMVFVTNLAITTSNSISLQASTLVHLTEATNQLTRTAALIASEKCYQLARALTSMSMQIPYEDVQTAANQISQCTSNVLTAINGPLQQRTSVLDLDNSRANTFPIDYDTDLEFDWANPNLFADGNDFSWETIEKGRNLYYQKQTALIIERQTTDTLSLLTSALTNHLNIGQNSIINTSSVYMSLETISMKSLPNKFIQPVGNAQIHLPSNFNSNLINNQAVFLRSLLQPLAPSDQSQKTSTTNLSTSLSLSILDRNGNELSIPTTSNYPYKFIIPRDPNVIIPSMTIQNVTAFTNISHHLLFNLHHIDITQSDNLTISVHIEMESLNQSPGYVFIYKFDQSPQLNSFINQTDGWSLFCPSNLTNDTIYRYFIDNQVTKDHQSLIFGLRELNTTEMIEFCSNQSMNNHPPITDRPFRFTSNYQLRIYTSGCYYLDVNSHWKSDGLVVGSETNHYETECFSSHLTTFAGGFLVLPSPINWNYVFANADFNKNKTIYLTVICISILYLLLTIYAHYKDRKDIEKLGVTSLPDNYKGDQYRYQILVFTGHRKNAGTKSNVRFIVAGDQDETNVRTFADPNRKIFQRGGIDVFIMAVPKSLGSLNYIRIWHDNRGEGSSSASWYLKYVIIRDLQTMEKSYFICQQWLAVEKGDGRIERVLPVAGELQKREFSYVLSKQAYHSLSDGHLWFSIFSRPPSNKFTRVQRCTCCFVLLFTSMVLNILYYDQTNEAKTKNSSSVSLSLGPLYITPEQIGIGIVVELLVFLPSLFLVQLFRRIQPRRSHHQQSLPYVMIAQNDKKKEQKLTFPWWFLFVAYGLSLLLVVASIFFIIVRGIEFGDLKTQKWLTSLITGFFSSILLIQPIKILSLAIFFAYFIRKSDHDKEAAEYLNHEDAEIYLQSTEVDSSFSSRSQIHANRLTSTELTFVRNQRLKELKMWSIIREILSYLCFLSLLYFVTYSNVNPNGFYQVQHLRKFVLNSRQINEDYTKISTINEYWHWLENSFVNNIRAQQWYNGDAPRYLSGFINDRSNRLIGWVRMKQLRIKSQACSVKQQFFSTCKNDYNMLNEEKRSFDPGWKLNNQTSNSTIIQGFQYQPGDELDSGGYMYEFRGRLSDLRSNLSELHRFEWIDSRTRAVIIDFSLYNPNVELFTSVILLTEFLSTGGVHPQSNFQPLSFQVFTSISQLICSILYMIFILYMIIEQVQCLIQLKIKYFHQFWSYIDAGIIICSCTSIGIFVWKYSESNRISDLFKQTNGYVYINLQLSVYINNVLIYVTGFCCFFGTIKFVRLCRFNQRILLFTKTIRYAGKELLSFSFLFSIIFMSFVCLFYLLFISKLSACSSFLSTIEILFEMILMKFDAHELSGAAAFLGPFCFSLFILLVVFICLSMFITIIMDNFRFVRDHAHQYQNEDEHIFIFMYQKFRQWIGLDTELEMTNEEMRRKYYDPIEYFPDKIDQLLNALNQLYIDQQKHPR